MSAPRADLDLPEADRERARAYLAARYTAVGDCWVWNGHKLHAGHGQAKWRGYPRKAHRLSYMAHIGPVGGMCVCHRCDNPPCINPAHLFLGTKGDNNRDAGAKGRYAGRAWPPVDSLERSRKASEQHAKRRALGLPYNHVKMGLGRLATLPPCPGPTSQCTRRDTFCSRQPPDCLYNTRR